MEPQYSDILVDHFTHPRNVGSLDKASPRVGTGIVGAEDCGDVIKLQIEAGCDGRIVESRFKTFGCGPAIATSSWTTEWLKGRTIGQAGELDRRHIAEQLSLPPAKLHCSALAEDAVRAAIEDWRCKQRPARAGAYCPAEACPAGEARDAPTCTPEGDARGHHAD